MAKNTPKIKQMENLLEDPDSLSSGPKLATAEDQGAVKLGADINADFTSGTGTTVDTGNVTLATYTIPKTGTYVAIGTCSINNGQSASTSLKFFRAKLHLDSSEKDNQLQGIGNFDGAATDYGSATVHSVFSATAGQVVSLLVAAGTAGIATAFAQNLTVFELPRIS